MNTPAESSPLAHLNWWRVLLPVLIGMGVSAYLLIAVSGQGLAALSGIRLTAHLFIGLGIAALTVLIRDLAYIYRIWQLTDCKLSFRSCLEVIMLWEFGSSITPASVGGITLALFILKKEKVSYGRGTAIILLCSYLDNIAFVSVFSILFLCAGTRMFDLSTPCIDLSHQDLFMPFRLLAGYAWTGFLVVAVIGGFLGFAIFVRPGWSRSFLTHLSGYKWLHRWSDQLTHLGEEIYVTSEQFRTRGRGFLLRLIAATTISWCARYALANAVIWTFSATDIPQWEVFVRQYVHRVIVMIPTTPGGSGIQEASFLALNCEYLPLGLGPAIAIVWRLFNFYIYLLIGAIILPRWLARVAAQSKNENTETII